MSDNKKPLEDVKFFALGGVGEVGKNLYCLDYLNQLFIIDAGILFPDDSLLGIDYVIPDFQYLVENENRIVGLFITHAHEDHIGGIPFLLKRVKIPKIYAGGFAIDLIQSKLSEHKDLPSVPIIEFKSHFKFNFKDTEVSFVRLNHSIPDSYGIAFKTSHGIFFHSGDFKFDHTPIGPKAELDKLAKMGNEGVLALTSDSTNALVEGFTHSERKVGNSIKELFSKQKGRIIVATFASNLYRVQQIVEASIMYNRKILVFGRSMEKTIEIGVQGGYIKAPKGMIIDSNEANKLAAEEITILCTGSQGEPLAALSRIANGSHKQIKLMPNDTVIFSSSPIPGNQESVNKTINLLYKNGVNVITNSPLTDTHTSGHAATEELKLLLSLTKPRYFIPVHGEYRMLKGHGNLAIETGVRKENVFIVQNGEVVSMNKAKGSITHKVPSGDVYIDGSDMTGVSSKLIRERKNLSQDGLFAIIFAICSKTKKMLSQPQVVSRGFIYMKDHEEMTKYFIAESTKYVEKELSKNSPINTHHLRQGLIDLLHNLILKASDREPVVRPIFSLLNKDNQSEKKNNNQNNSNKNS